MKRGKPLKRRKPMRARSPNRKPRERRKTKYAQRERDTEYMLWVKTQSCVASIVVPLTAKGQAIRCEGAVEADHAGRRGIGRKADDLTCIPLCTKHHGDRTDVTGIFKHAKQDYLREWIREAILWTVNRGRVHFAVGWSLSRVEMPLERLELLERLDAIAMMYSGGM